jgi:hypothetical protein
MISRIPQEILERRAQESARRYREKQGPPANEEAVRHLRPDRMLFRGRRFRVRPISYIDGLQIQRLRNEIEDLQDLPETEEGLQRLENLQGRIVKTFHPYVTPVGFWERLFWRWRSNPFGNATEAEIADLFRFFSWCRTRSAVRHSSMTESQSG